MIRPIVKDINFLKLKSTPANASDKHIADDLIDTLSAHREECVGMAANMIGENKNIIIVSMGFMPLVMFNPVIVKREEPYSTEEGCLSLIGTRPCVRYRKITVEYQDSNFKKHTGTYEDWTAQIIQHEMDHLHGIII